MEKYPMTSLCFQPELWVKKVVSIHVSTFQNQLQFTSIIQQFIQILSRLLSLPLSATFQDPTIVQFFFQNCFPSICQRLIKSKSFIDEKMLRISNRVLELCVEVYVKYFQMVDKYPEFSRVIEVVLNQNQRYYEINDQMVYELYPWKWWKEEENKEDQFVGGVKVGDEVDAIKYQKQLGVACWSRAKVVQDKEYFFQIEFANTTVPQTVLINKSSIQIAPFKTKSHDFEWRLNLKVGDQVDYIDKNKSWFRCNVENIKQTENGKVIELSFTKGEKDDDLLYCFFDSREIDVTSPQIQPPGTILKITSSFYKHNQHVYAPNDHLVSHVGTTEITVVPRKDCLSETYLRILRKFVQNKGIELIINKLQKSCNVKLFLLIFEIVGTIYKIFHIEYLLKIASEMKETLDLYLAKDEIALELFGKQHHKNLLRNIQKIFKESMNIEEYNEISKQNPGTNPILSRYNDYFYNLRKTLAMKLLNCKDQQRRIICLQHISCLISKMQQSSPKQKTQFTKWLSSHYFYHHLILYNPSVNLIKKSHLFYSFLLQSKLIGGKQVLELFESAPKQRLKIKSTIYDLIKLSLKSHFDQVVDHLLEKIVMSQDYSSKIYDLKLLEEIFTVSNKQPIRRVMEFYQSLLFEHKSTQEQEEWIIDVYSLNFIREFMDEWREEHLERVLGKLGTEKIYVALNLMIGLMTRIEAIFKSKDSLKVILNYQIDKILINLIIENKSSEQNKPIVQKSLLLLRKLIALDNKLLENTASIALQLDNIFQNSPTPDLHYQQYYNFCYFLLPLTKSFPQFCLKRLQLLCRLKQPQRLKKLTIESYKVIIQLFENGEEQGNLFWEKKKKVVGSKTFPETQEYTIIKDIICNVSDQKVFALALKYFNDEYIPSSPEQKLIYLSSVLEDFFHLQQTEQTKKIKNILLLIKNMIQSSQQSGLSPIKYLKMFRKEQKIKLNIQHGISNFSPATQFQLSSNSTLFHLKHQIGSKLNAPWKQIHLQHPLSEEPLNQIISQCVEPNCVVQFKQLQITPNYDLVHEGKLVSKAREAFLKIFRKFSTNGLMSKLHGLRFVAACIGEAAQRTYDSRVRTVFEACDSDRDCFITQADFMEFFEDASIHRAGVVTYNLRSLGVKENFEEIGEVGGDMLDQNTLPRYHLGTNINFITSLFELSHWKELGQAVWKTLLLLPPKPETYQNLSNLPLEQILNIKNPYQTLYYLYIISDLFNNTQKEQKQILCRQRLVKQNICTKILIFISDIAYVYIKVQLDEVFFQLVEIIIQITESFVIRLYNCQQIHNNYDTTVKTLQSKEKDKDDQNSQEQTRSFNPNYYFHNIVQQLPIELINTIIHKLLKIVLSDGQSPDILQSGKDLMKYSLIFTTYSNSFSNILQIAEIIFERSFAEILHYLMAEIVLLINSKLVTDKELLIEALIRYLCDQKNGEKVMVYQSEKEGCQEQSAFYQNFGAVLTMIQGELEGYEVSQQYQQKLLSNIFTSKCQEIVRSSAYILQQAKITPLSNQQIQSIFYLLDDQNTSISNYSKKYIYRILLSVPTQNPELLQHISSLILSTLSYRLLQSEITSRHNSAKLLHKKLNLKVNENQSFALCFIQILFHIYNYKKYILDVPQNYMNLKGNDSIGKQFKHLFYHYQQLFKYLEISKRNLYESPLFSGIFLHKEIFEGYTLENYLSKLNRMLVLCQQASRDVDDLDVYVNDVFRWKIEKSVRCLGCGFSIVEKSNLLVLKLSGKEEEEGGVMRVGEMIQKYFEVERIKCSICEGTVEVSKILNQCPQTLLIAIDRRNQSQQKKSFESGLQFQQKISLSIDSSQQHNTEDPKAKQYSLIATIAHVPNSDNFSCQIKDNPAHGWQGWHYFDRFQTKYLSSEQYQQQYFRTNLGQKQTSQANNVCLLVYQKGTNFWQDSKQNPLKYKRDYSVSDKFFNQITKDNQTLHKRNEQFVKMIIQIYAQLPPNNILKQDYITLIDLSLKTFVKIGSNSTKIQFMNALTKLSSNHPDLFDTFAGNTSLFKPSYPSQIQEEVSQSFKKIQLTLVKGAFERRKEEQSNQIPQNKNLMSFLKLKKGRLQLKYVKTITFVIRRQVEFWEQIIGFSKEGIRYALQLNLIKYLEQILLYANSEKDFEIRFIDSLEYIILEMISYNDQHKIHENMHKCLLYNKILQSISLNNQRLFNHIISNYCLNDRDVSKQVISLITSQFYNIMKNQKSFNFIHNYLSLQDEFQLERIKLAVGTPILYFDDQILFCFRTNDPKRYRYHHYTSWYKAENNKSLMEIIIVTSLYAPSHRISLFIRLLFLSYKNRNIRQYLAELLPPFVEMDNLFDYLKHEIKEYFRSSQNLNNFNVYEVANQDYCFRQFVVCLLAYFSNNLGKYVSFYSNKTCANEYLVCKQFDEKVFEEEQQYQVFQQKTQQVTEVPINKAQDKLSKSIKKPFVLAEQRVDSQLYKQLLGYFKKQFHSSKLQFYVYPITFHCAFKAYQKIQCLNLREFQVKVIFYKSQIKGLTPQQVNQKLEKLENNGSVVERVSRGWEVKNQKTDCDYYLISKEGAKIIGHLDSVKIETNEIRICEKENKCMYLR